MKFKVGQRVRVIKDKYRNVPPNSIVTIIHISLTGNSYNATFYGYIPNPDFGWFFNKEDLEPLNATMLFKRSKK